MIAELDKFTVVKEEIPLLEAIEKYGFKPVKRGKYYFITCPFHPDKNPSMAIYKEAYHCFGCGAHGDVIDFTAGLFNLDPIEAVYKLADDFNVPLPNGRTLTKKEKKKIQQRIKQKQEEDKLYNDFLKAVDQTYDYLCELNHLYTKIKQVINDPKDLELPEFVEACHNQDLINYWLDLLLEGTIQDKLTVILEVEEWKQKQKYSKQ
ncbi:MAG TPA: molecular chaperone [Thermoanaerobacter sp.]|nr:molecular chaperone [Thermoanaerobacter sp.]